MNLPGFSASNSLQVASYLYSTGTFGSSSTEALIPSVITRCINCDKCHSASFCKNKLVGSKCIGKEICKTSRPCEGSGGKQACCGCFKS